MHLDDAAGGAFGHLDVVGHHHNGQPFAVEVAEERNNGGRIVLVEIPRRFVGKQNLRLFDQGAGDCHPLLLAPGQVRRPVVEPVRHPEAVENGCRAVTPLAAGNAGKKQPQFNVFQCCLVGYQVERLEDHADLPGAVCREFAAGKPVEALRSDFYVAGSGSVEACQQVEQGRFARAGCPHNGGKLAPVDREVHAVDGAYFVAAALIVPAQAGSLDPGILHD